MICNNCETDNPEGAVYCKNCGSRLDGKTICPSCGNKTPADGKFCIFCGSDTSAKQKAAKSAAPAKTQATESPQNSKKAAAVAKTVFNKTALGAALACVLFSLIFVFLIGVVLEVEYYGIYSDSLKRTFDIKDFLGKNFDNYKATIDQIDRYNLTANEHNAMTHFTADAQLISYIFQTVIMASTIIAVLVLSVIATIYTVRNLLGKSQKNGVKYAIASYLVYVLGTALLYSVLNVDISVETVETSAELSDATVAGLVLGGIFAAIAVTCRVCEQGKELLNVQTITKYSFALVGIVLFAVTLGLCSAPAVEMKEGIEDYGETGYLYFITGLGATFSNREDYQAVGSAFGTAVLGTVAFILVCVIAAFAVMAMISYANNLQKGKSKTLPYVIVTFVAAIALLVISIIMGNEFNKAMYYLYGTEGSADFDYAIPIGILVVSALALVANIAHLIVKGATKQPQELQTEY
ncbi:MAG: zinc ribbon domain-containing protein [Clostridia bacterium]|nr:zinc ribbon domain-containing protein [Clostridia bacterium]